MSVSSPALSATSPGSQASNSDLGSVGVYGHDESAQSFQLLEVPS